MRVDTAAVPAWLAGLSRGIYTFAWLLSLPIVMGYLLWRSRRQPEYRRHWGERFGRPGAEAHSHEPLIWIHAVSVGETRAAEPLIKGLLKRWPTHHLLLTHMTPTGRATGQALFADELSEQRMTQVYLPYDLPWLMSALLRHYQPVVGVIMETELWPNLVAAATRQGTPLVIANARLSEKSLARGLRFRALLAPALQKVSLVLAQTDADAARINQLAAVEVAVTGNLKFDVLPDPSLLALGRDWRRQLARSVVLFASSRDGEEQLVLEAWRSVAREDVALVIVPRHPQRFDEVRALMSQVGLAVADRQTLESGGQMTPDQSRHGLLLGDSMGEMPAWYAMADVVLMGGSFLAHGGQNLIEACACGAPVILGTSTFNFKQAADQAVQAGAAIRVADAAQGVHQALALISDPSRREAMSEGAVRFASAHSGATVLSVEQISGFVTPQADTR